MNVELSKQKDQGRATVPAGYNHVTIDVEDVNTGQWHAIAWSATYEGAETIQAALKSIGLDATISCACGSYEAGECELCGDMECAA
jgi:hypothetical protein